MLQNLAWQKIDDVARAQLAMFHIVGDEVGLDETERRQVLALDERGWADWTAFMADGPLPMAPALPEMLRRVGEMVFALAAGRVEADEDAAFWDFAGESRLYQGMGGGGVKG